MPLLVPCQLHTLIFHQGSSQETTPTPKPLTVDRLEALLHMQKTDPFCKLISKWLLNGKSPQHEFDTFTHVKGLLYKHVTDSGKQFLALVIPKSWKFTVLVEVHDKLGHQGNSCMYCLIKRQYYWKGMNKDIRKCIANCVLCRWEKAKVQQYPLQMTEIPDTPFDKNYWSCHWVLNINFRQQTYLDYNRPSHWMARNILLTWQICRYHSLYIY